MKNPNGYGSIVRLSGKRRKPYGVRVTTFVGLDESDKFIQKRKYIGYYETKAEALEALNEYHKNPGMIDQRITFAELYERWSSEKFPTISAGLCRGYRSAFKAVPELHNKRFIKLQPVNLQWAIDHCGKSPDGQRRIIGLFSQLYQYASFHRIIPNDVNPAHLLHRDRIPKSTAHHRFNPQEVQVMWNNSESDYIQMVLMMIYTGVRPGEMFALKSGDVHLDQQFFYIRSGKNENAIRAVPIPDKVLPFFQNWKDKDTEYLVTLHGVQIKFSNHVGFLNHIWQPALEPLGIYQSKDIVTGETYSHLPYDTRHTFASMWADKKLDERTRRRIMGHAGKGIGEEVYTHLDMQAMLAEINKL